MQLKVSLILGLCDAVIRNRIARERSLAEKIDPSEFRVQVDSASPEFERLVEITRGLGHGLVWTPWVHYTSVDGRYCEHFEVWPRRSIPEGALWEKNRESYQRSSPIETLPGLLVRIQSPIRVSSIKNFQRNMAGNLGDACMELIVGGGVVEAFVEAGLHGYSLQPVLCGKAQTPHPDFFHLVSENFVPQRACRDISTRGEENLHEGPGILRRLGLLSYEPGSLPHHSDFFRTAEGWYAGQPLWIVSRRVADTFQAKKLKGLSFRPVLTVGTKLQSDYLRAWERLFEMMAENPHNRLW